MGWIFHAELYYVTFADASGIFDRHATTLTLTLTFDLLNPKTNRLLQSVENYYCAKFQSHFDQGFSFYHADIAYTPTYIIHCGKVIAITAKPYYVAGADYINRRSDITRICAAEMAVRYAALSAFRKVHVCHCNSLGGATWRSACRKVHPWR